MKPKQELLRDLLKLLKEKRKNNKEFQKADEECCKLTDEEQLIDGAVFSILEDFAELGFIVKIREGGDLNDFCYTRNR